MAEASGDILRAIGRLEGRFDSMEKALGDHRAESAAGMATLQGAVTTRMNNHADRLTSLEHTRTENKTAKRIFLGVGGFLGVSNIVLLIKTVPKLWS